MGVIMSMRKEVALSIADPEQDYYHINRNAQWSEYEQLNSESVFDVGGGSNPYFKFFEERRKSFPVTNSDNGEVMDVLAVKFVGSALRGEINAPDALGIAHQTLTHFVAYIRELIWEDVRKNEFPHLPSRQRCLWIVPNIEGVRYWCNRLGLADTEYQVLRVRVQGRLHTASESYLLGDSEPHSASLQKARQYWLGIVDDQSTQEVIFEGKVNVQEIVDPSVYA